MKIKYSILWIDDESMTHDIGRIKRYLEEETGFIPVIDKIDSINGTLNLNFKKYNLIILDYQLDNSKTTDPVLKKIKEKDYYSEVIFYSARTNFEDHIKNNIGMFEGVFWCDARGQTLYQKIIKVIDLTLKKFQDLNNLRGLVMAETADLDKLKKEIFKEYFNLSHKDKSTFEKEICSRIEKSFKDNLKKIKKHQGKKITITEENYTSTRSGNIMELLDDLIFDFSKKGRCIQKLLELLDSKVEFKFSEYENSIINKRNKLAHEPEREQNGSIYFGNLEFTPEECKIIRDDIKKYKKLFDSLIVDIKKISSEKPK